MKPNFIGAAAFSAFTLFALPSQAAIIFSDTFSDLSNGAWYTAATGTNSGTLDAGSGALVWSETGGGIQEVFGRSIPTTTVAVGETLRLTYSYTPGTGNSIIRAGFYDLNGTISQNGWGFGETALTGAFSGFTSFLRVDSNLADHAARHDSGTLNTITTGTANGPLQGGTSFTTISGADAKYTVSTSVTYTVVYEVTRTGTNSYTTSFSLSSDGTTHLNVVGSGNSSVAPTFDAVTLRQTGGSAIYDDITLEILPIPEPSAALLSAIGFSGLLARRKRLK